MIRWFDLESFLWERESSIILIRQYILSYIIENIEADFPEKDSINTFLVQDDFKILGFINCDLSLSCMVDFRRSLHDEISVNIMNATLMNEDEDIIDHIVSISALEKEIVKYFKDLLNESESN